MFFEERDGGEAARHVGGVVGAEKSGMDIEM